MTTITNRPPLVTTDLLARDYEHLVNAADAFTSRAAHDVPGVCEDDEDLGIVTEFVKAVRAERKRVSEIGDGEKRPYLDAHKTLHTWFNQLWQRLGELQDAVEARGNAYLAKKQSEIRKRCEEIERKAREEAEAARVAAVEAAKKPPNAQTSAAITAAAEAQAKADDAARAAAAKPADLTRTRTAAGTASISTRIEFSFDRGKLNLEVLRPFLREDELRAAINAICIKNREAIIAGTFKLEGVNFYQKARGNYR